MRFPSKDELKPLGVAAIVLIAVSLITSIFGATSIGRMFGIAVAIFFYLIVPGYFILLNFSNLDSVERIFLGMAVSAATVPLLLYGANIFGIRISVINTWISIFFVVFIAMFFRKRNEKPPQVPKEITEKAF